MTIVATKKHGEEFSGGTQLATLIDRYRIIDTTGAVVDKIDAYNTLASAAIAATYTGFVLRSYTATESNGGKVWTGQATYMQADSAFQFDTGGGTIHRTTALKHISDFACAIPNGSTSPTYFVSENHHGMINVNQDGGVDGVDVVSPVFRCGFTLYLPPSSVGASYITNLYKLTGSTNDADIAMYVYGMEFDFSHGELLFEGVSGGIRGAGDLEISFRFAAQPSVTDVCADWGPAKPSASVPKKGWELAWVKTQPYEDTTTTPHTIVQVPKGIHIERIYPEVDMTLLNIPSPPP